MYVSYFDNKSMDALHIIYYLLYALHFITVCVLELDDPSFLANHWIPVSS
jgi:hypothetical protein